MSLIRKISRTAQKFLRRYLVTDDEPLWMGGGGGADTGLGQRGTAGWLRTYETAARLHAVVGKIAEGVACVPWHVYKKSGKKLTEVDSGPLLDWMRRPWISCTGGTFYDLMSLTSAWIDTVGEAFWLVTHNPDGTPKDTVPIPPSWVSMTPADGVDCFIVCIPHNLSQTAERVPPRNMIWFRRPSAAAPFWRGRGRAQSLDDEVTQEELASKFETSYFRNSARPELVAFVEGLEEDPLGVKRLRQQWEEVHRGPLNAHRIAFLPAKGRLEQVSVNLKDMALVELRNFHRDVIFQAFGMPPEIMGVVENSNRATVEAAVLIYQKEVLLPRCIWFLAQFERWFLPKYKDPNLVMRFENPVQETQEFALKKNIENFKAGVISRDECRQNQQIDPFGGIRGEAVSVPLNTVEMDPDGSFRSPPKQVDPPPDAPADAPEENPDPEPPPEDPQTKKLPKKNRRNDA